MKIKISGWKIGFYALMYTTLIAAGILGGIITVLVLYMFDGLLIALISDFIYPRIILTWGFEFWFEED